MPPMAEDCQPQVDVRHCKRSRSRRRLQNNKTMQYQFTPAAERAICHAAAWLGGSDCNEWPGVALLLGLLAEPECRAALMLARCGIDTSGRERPMGEKVNGEPEASASGCKADQSGVTPAITRRPIHQSGGDENPSRPASPISLAKALPAIEIFLQAAQGRLVDFSRPLTLATEHLLLGLVAAEHEVSHWLRQRGMDPDALEKEIHAIYGHRPEPLPLEAEMADGTARRRLDPRLANSRRRRQSGPGRAPRGRGLCPLRAGRSALDRAVQGLASRSGGRTGADCRRRSPGGAGNSSRRGHARSPRRPSSTAATPPAC